MEHPQRKGAPSHWFDAIAKAAGGASLSRRSAIAGTAAAVGSVAFARSLAHAATAESALDVRPDQLLLPNAGSPCALRVDSTGMLTSSVTAQTEYDGKPLVLRSAVVSTGRGRDRSLKLRMAIELSGALVAQVGLLRRPTGSSKGQLGLAQRVSITYGTEVSGMSHVEMADVNGQLAGQVDGRAFQMNRRVSNPSPQFSGTRVRPQLRVAATLSQAVAKLLASAQSSVQSCKREARRDQAPYYVARTRAMLLALPGLNGFQNGGGADGTGGGAQVVATSACDSCTTACETLGPFECLYGLYQAVGKFFSDPIGVLDGSDNICQAWVDCENGCFVSGGPCCGVHCNSEGGGSYCCGEGQFCCANDMGVANCCDPGGVCASGTDPIYLAKDTICCPAGYSQSACVADDSNGNPLIYCHKSNEACCGGYFPCAPGQFCADAYFSICCENGQSYCAGACCDGTCITYNAGTSADQVCCPKSSVCGSICCEANEKCYSSHSGAKICCTQPLCGGNQCCGGGEICSNGRCGYGQPCGGGFCAPLTQICVNGACVNRSEPTPNPLQACPSSLRACAPPQNFKGKPACCNPSTQTCCGSTCCNSPSVCQDPYTGQCVEVQ